MDPKYPGQNAGGPTPDPWAQPPAPGQPPDPWAQSPAPGQPPDPWAQPPAPGQPQPPAQPDYGQPPYGTPPAGLPPQGWAPTPGFDPSQPGYGQPWGPVPAPKKSILPKVIGAIVIFVIVIVGLFAALLILNPSHAGEVVFTTDAPTSGSAKTCQIGHQVTEVPVGTPVYAIYFYKDRLSNETVSLTVTKDGQAFIPATALTSDMTNGIDCLEDTSNLGELLTGAGKYEFKLTTSSGDVVSDGTITLK